MADDLKGMIGDFLRSCTSDACKMVSKLVAFSWEIYKAKIYKAKDEWGPCEQLLTSFQDFNDFKSLNATSPLQIVQEGENIALYDNPILNETLL